MNETDNWEACPPRLLTSLGQRARRRRLTKIVAATVAATCMVALLGFGGWYAQMQGLQREFQFSGITCAEVRELLPAFQSRRLDARRSEMLRAHVERCPNCAQFREIVLGTKTAQRAAGLERMAAADFANRYERMIASITSGGRREWRSPRPRRS